ncbi:hypothetical protein I302_103908 [Kwoniella bestiolae CBS 10118]|uniref:Uncharacterized protein n=1 Tax=Kwoniella bestiolae CBS 10118 TaxID=1296100 RepID=A0A1B9G9T0_9TREE|nr:hypothetical protein I302_02613 [Kwoniella bestiolae CBS 10118]OCF27767.1 hypothetical protein I302_02613 [Kwoniella bestiolae CBS 10118]
MTTAGPSSIARHSPHPHPAPSPYHTHQYRHHPYAPTPNTKNTPSSSSSSRQYPRSSPNGELPPSPPRSRRDGSETPSIGLGVAFGGSAGGKWWDEELPPPPASLSSILDSFRKSGEGDRELLLSILGAKKAEEERLTALIQTRLTVLQARLSLHSAAASLPPPQMTVPPPNPGGSPSQLENEPINVERTPSLTSSRGAGSTSSGMPSPPLPQQTGYVQPPPPTLGEKEQPSVGGRGYWQLPSLQSSLRAPPTHTPARSPHSPNGLPLAPIREVRINGSNDRRAGSLSPKSTGSEGKRSSSGLEMLLDAGRVVNESAERDQ